MNMLQLHGYAGGRARSMSMACTLLVCSLVFLDAWAGWEISINQIMVMLCWYTLNNEGKGLRII
jgi:hypothetical protein